MLARATPGEKAVAAARTGWLDPDAKVKVEVDVLKVALREIKRGKSVEFNRHEGEKRLAGALGILGRSAELAAATAEWTWLAAERASASKPAYQAKEKAFFARFTSPLSTLGAAHPKAQTKYWLKNIPPQVMNIVIEVSDASLPASQLFCYAAKEGLIDYVRAEIGLAATADPTMAQLKSVSTTKTVSGFVYLGVDDFWADLTAKNEPLTKHLPAGYSTAALPHVPHINESQRTVDSTDFPGLKPGLQALAASIKRRRALFLADVSAHGYAAPTTDELVYWTYVYYNSGEFNGQLRKHKGKRKLSDWITKGEFPNSIKLLESYRMLQAMKIF